MFTSKLSSTSVLFTLFSMLFCLRSKCPLACDKIRRLKAGNGTLLSEEKLAHFMGPTSCVWEIEAPPGYRIELTVSVFEIKTSCCSCRNDYVEFRDGMNSTSPFIGRYCANKKPMKIYSSQNMLRVQYFSSPRGLHANLTSVNKFRASYRKICGKFYRGTSGEISSPNFATIGRCLFTIVVPYGWVQVTFTHFKVHMYSLDRCMMDFVVAKEMALVELKDTARGPESMCGMLKSPYVFSRGRELSLLYRSSHKSSFVAKFEATNRSLAPCGGVLHARTPGYIYSYGYPQPYPIDTECVWKIEVPYGYIKLQFLIFNFTLKSTSCTDGKVEIYDGWSSNSVKIGKSHCGRLHKYKSEKSQSRRLLIKAKSGKNASQTGTFVLSYSLVEDGLCSAEEFCCTNRECVKQDAVCDGLRDCSDGSDELNCPKKKANKALYVLWVLIVLIASILMVIWLWRTWRKAVRHTVHVQSDQQQHCHDTEDYACEVPSQSGAPPTYSEALNHTPTSLPSYEEALLSDNGGVILQRGDTVRFLARSDSCNDHLLPTCDSQRL